VLFLVQTERHRIVFYHEDGDSMFPASAPDSMYSVQYWLSGISSTTVQLK
jgi:hypothetical protein